MIRPIFKSVLEKAGLPGIDCKAMKPYGKVKLSDEPQRRQAELKALNLSEE